MLIEIITSYSHSISIVSNTFDILLFLSSQCARRAAASPVAVLRGPLKKAGVMRMIDSIYSAYDNDEAMSTTDSPSCSRPSPPPASPPARCASSS